MKYKVIKLEDNKSVLVDDSAEIKEGDYYCVPHNIEGHILSNKTLIIKATHNFICNHYIKTKKGFHQKVVTTINHSIDKDIPMVIVEDEIEKLALDDYNAAYPSYEKVTDYKVVEKFRSIQSYIRGHKAAQQKGVYTEEDMYTLAAKVVNDIAKNQSNADFNFFTTPKMIADEFIQSINQEDIELEMEDYLTQELALKGNFQNFRIKTNRVNGQLMAYILSKKL